MQKDNREEHALRCTLYMQDGEKNPLNPKPTNQPRLATNRCI
jgi:hypothetical protein